MLPSSYERRPSALPWTCASLPTPATGCGGWHSSKFCSRLLAGSPDEHVPDTDMWEETESEAKIDDRAILVRLVFAEGLLQVPCSKIAARGGSCSSSSAVA